MNPFEVCVPSHKKQCVMQKLHFTHFVRLCEHRITHFTSSIGRYPSVGFYPNVLCGIVSGVKISFSGHNTEQTKFVLYGWYTNLEGIVKKFRMLCDRENVCKMR